MIDVHSFSLKDAKLSGRGAAVKNNRRLSRSTDTSTSKASSIIPQYDRSGSGKALAKKKTTRVSIEARASAPKAANDDAPSRGDLGLTGKSRSFRFTKRAIDIVGALAGLVMLAPLLIGCAIAIKATSRGPVFFRQSRYGLNSKPFRIYKFRTMYTDQGDTSGVQQTTVGDPRITRVGAFLRRTSFDELPQLINVLDGSMSLVGPRPHVPNMLAAGVRYENFDPRYFDRHTMVPGITGLAQVNGYRGETVTYQAAKGRIDKDIEYVRTATIKGDIKILLKTVRCEFLSGSGF